MGKTMQVQMYMAQSVDGFIADADGGVGFLDDFQDLDYGYADFITRVSVIAMGRKSYEQILGFGPWPYADKYSLVHTSQPIADPPRQCEPWRGKPEELVAAWRKNQGHRPGHLWVLGGPQLCSSYLEADLVDRLDLFVMPLLLGQGLPLLSRPIESLPLTLVEQKGFDNGVVQLSYERPRSAKNASFIGQSNPPPTPLSQKADLQED